MLKKIILYVMWWIFILLYFLNVADKNSLILISFTLVATLICLVAKRKKSTDDNEFENCENVKNASLSEDKDVSPADTSDKAKETDVVPKKKKSVLNKFKSKEHLVKLVLAEVLTISSLLLFIDIFKIQCFLPVVLFVGMFISFLIWLEWGRKTSVYGILFLVFGFILIGFIQRNPFATEGVLILYNRIVDTIGTASGYEITKFVVSAGDTSYYLYLSYIMSLGAAFFGLLSYFIVTHKQRFFLYIYSIIISVLLIVFRIETSWIYFTLFVISVLCVCLYHYIKKANKCYFNLVISSLVIMVISLGVSYPINRLIKTHRTPLEVFYESYLYNESATDSYGNGAISGNKLVKSDLAALEITMTNPAPVYLRGFTGSEFNGNRWLTLSNADVYNNRELFYILNKNSFSPLNQMEYYVKAVDETSVSDKISIKYINSGDKYLFLPYGLAGDISADVFETRADYVIRKSGGVEKYSMQLYTGMYSDISEYEEALQESVTTDLYEQHYEDYVYNTYLKVESKDRDTINEVLIRNNAVMEVDNKDYETITALVRAVINKELTYDENVKVSLLENDCLDLLFNNYHKGYDIHFATAATLLFRYFGVPARYVEGYTVSINEAAKINSDIAYEVKGTNAHAWTEIYISGIGWMPVEIRDEDYEKMFGEFDELIITLGENYGNTSNSVNNNSFVNTYVVFIFIIILILVLVLFAVVFIRRIVIIKRRNALFNSSDYKKAVEGYYGYFCKVLDYCDLFDDGDRAVNCLQKYREYVPESEITNVDKMIGIFQKAQDSGKIKKKDYEFISDAVQRNIGYITDRQTLIRNIGLYLYICV